MSARPTLIIGTKQFSSWSLRPWLAAKMAGIAFDEVVIALRQPDTKANIMQHSPSGKVPCLIDGDLAVWDSLAICEYLAEQVPSLWPEDRAARAVARAVSAEMHSGFQNLRNLCSMDVLSDLPMAEIAPELAPEVARINAMWTDCRTRFGLSGPFLFGRFSVADAMYAPVVTRFKTYYLPLEPVPAAYADAVMALPAMAEWIKGATTSPSV
ncbi:glutathione S-transferase family protein [Magnetospirillum moscoviense]|uniref:Glutathione S-transferase n=1 Tax=Magnetospirillum moscoviense TaxID=1437059 RepID=A0A178N0Q5_9PROT|nr:glutathione S-transferase family protein [Magnetospirillum moscoviense]OAN60945.1 glutathione S-transferase [Magnetospirillum moscoviense]